MKLTKELKEQIDSYDVYTLLYKVRFAPIGDPMMQDESGKYWIKRLAEKRDENNAAYVQASKTMGWDKRG